MDFVVTNLLEISRRNIIMLGQTLLRKIEIEYNRKPRRFSYPFQEDIDRLQTLIRICQMALDRFRPCLFHFL